MLIIFFVRLFDKCFLTWPPVVLELVVSHVIIITDWQSNQIHFTSITRIRSCKIMKFQMQYLQLNIEIVRNHSSEENVILMKITAINPKFRLLMLAKFMLWWYFNLLLLAFELHIRKKFAQNKEFKFLCIFWCPIFCISVYLSLTFKGQ